MVFTKQGNSGKRRRPDTREQVSRKCERGEVGKIQQRNIKSIVDAFRKQRRGSKAGLGADGLAISFLENIELSENIIAVFREVKAIPQNAKILDFPEKNTISSNVTPWIATFQGDTDIHPDIVFNASVGKGAFTMVYVVECKEPIKYLIYGRKKNTLLDSDEAHLEELNAGSWMTFPSDYFHHGSGLEKRVIISLTFLPHKETFGEEIHKKIDKRVRSGSYSVKKI